MTKKYNGAERRQFVRFDYITPLAYKVCKKTTLSKLLQGYTADISQGGLRCRLREKVAKNNIIWLSFDRNLLDVCRGIDRKCMVYQNGVIGKVVWATRLMNKTYDIGIRFLTREEKNLTNIYPKSYFFDLQQQKGNK